MSIELKLKIDDLNSDIRDQQTPSIAVIGAGAWGQNIIRNFHELGVLTTVCDVRGERLIKFKKQYPTTHVTTNYYDILNSDYINCVVIATPAATHYEIAKLALLAKKHVYVEKPLALTVEEARDLVNVAETKKCKLMVGHILRYHPAITKLKEIIDSGELGNIKYVYSRRLNIGKIRTEESILWSFAPHDISVILYLLNEQPESVYANGGGYVKNDIADVTLTMMDFPSGVKSHIFVSWLHPFKEQKLVVVGGKKMAVFDELTEEKLFLYPHKIEWQQRIPVACKAEAEVVPVDMSEPLKLECQHFLDCVENDHTPLTDGYEGLRVLTILFAAQESFNNNCRRVSLDKIEREKPKRENVFIHSSALVDEACEIGKGTKVWHNSQIQAGAEIGKQCTIGHNCFIGAQAKLGNGVKLESNIDVWDLVTLEDYVFVGPSAVFTNDTNPRARFPKKKFPQYGKWIPTVVKKGASIGANATIVCGVTIGKNAFVGAGTVVTKNVPDYAVVVGVPSKIIGWMCQCGTKLIFKDNKASCSKCSCKYQMKDGTVVYVGRRAEDINKS
jgi:UDP-2-acetamido-3-amino-2,3-dideoxy-glucuronate N-acetyltransferase